MFKNLSFKRKIIALVATAVVGIVALSVVTTLRKERMTIEARQGELVTAVQSAYNIASAYQARAASGAMSDEDARKAAIDAIRNARYGGADGKTEYFHVWTLDGVSVMHPFKPEWAGQNMLGKLLGSSGEDTLKRLLEVVAASPEGRAFSEAWFQKPGQTESVPKLQYGMKVAGWNWVVGSGLYMDDLNALLREELVRGLMVTFALLAAVAGVGYAVARSVLRQIGGDPSEAIATMDAVARGNLGVSIEGAAPGSVMHGLQSMIGALRGTIVQVHESTDGIRTASNEIAIGNTDLSQRTEETASNLQQTASSLEQITGTVKQTADSARTASQLAATASDAAARGGAVVQKVVSTMDEIHESSRRIADIIGTIDGIAFQTNILALNAAVEAARAGEQGRGFAVVASEVRSLAQRSAGAAKEIKSLIEASVERVQSGAKLVGDAGSTMSEIVASVQRVTDMIGEITAASSEQSVGIGQINTAVTQLDQMTQQNAALVEESAAAAESLKQQAAKLGEVVGVFRLDETPATPASRAALDPASAVIARARESALRVPTESVARSHAGQAGVAQMRAKPMGATQAGAVQAGAAQAGAAQAGAAQAGAARTASPKARASAARAVGVGAPVRPSAGAKPISETADADGWETF